MKEFRINMYKNSDKKLENAKMLIKDCCKILSLLHGSHLYQLHLHSQSQ